MKKLHDGHKIYIGLITVILILILTGIISWLNISSLHQSTQQYVQNDELIDSLMHSQLKAMKYRSVPYFDSASDTTDTIVQTIRLAKRLSQHYKNTEAESLYKQISEGFHQYEKYIRQLVKIKQQETQSYIVKKKYYNELILWYKNYYITIEYQGGKSLNNTKLSKRLHTLLIELAVLNDTFTNETQWQKREQAHLAIKVLIIEALKITSSSNQTSEQARFNVLAKALQNYQSAYDNFSKNTLDILKTEQRINSLLDNFQLLIYRLNDRQREISTNNLSLSPLLPSIASIFILSFIILVFIIRKSTNSIVKMANRMKEAKLQADKANESKSDFLANISHEIRTPMNAIIGSSNLLINSELTKKQRQYLETINKSSESLLNIINNILDFSKIESNKLTLNNTEFKLEEVFESLIDNLSVFSYKKSIELMFDIPVALQKSYLGDQAKLNQVLLNLGNNAIKFTEQGEILISVIQVAQENNNITLQFTVKDNGIGIKDEDIERVFNAFFQADSSSTRQYGGTGLGLAISKKLVKLMGGDIWLNRNTDKGCEFNITTQLTMLDPQPISYHIPPIFKNMNALIIDDSSSSRAILAKMLRELGMTVTTAESGGEALSIILSQHNTNPIQLLLVDGKMTPMDGCASVEHITSAVIARNYLMPKVIMVSAYDKEEIELIAEELTVNAFVKKPITPSHMLNSLLIAFNEPLHKLNSTVTKMSALHQSVEQLAGANILLVEDNDINLELVSDLLTRNHINVTCARQGKEALLILKHKAFDGILMDCQMPIMDGYQATVEIRKTINFRDLPIIAITANVLLKDKEKAFASGMNDYINKPFTPEHLLATMAKWIIPSTPVLVPQRTKEKIKKLPSTNAINFQLGLEICTNNTALYQGLLKKFLMLDNTFLETFNELITKKDHTGAKGLVHSIRGSSGNIGATNLQKLTEKLERSFDDSRLTTEDLCRQAILINEEMSRVIQCIKNSSLSSPPRNEFPLSVDNESVVEKITYLRTLLASNSAEANDLIEDIEILLNNTFGKYKVKPLVNAIDNYDFDDALAILETFHLDI